ncbi:MAG: hypothetical protein R3B90_13225 [Planctomycetaceae bacterium]
MQKGKVWMLQTRNAKRTGFAAVRIAVDLVNEGLITPKQALAKRASPRTTSTSSFSRSSIPPRRRRPSRSTSCSRRGSTPARAPRPARSSSTPATPKSRWNADNNLQLILVRKETSPEDCAA